MSTNIAPSEFTRVRRLAKRAIYDQETLYAIIDAARYCHLGHIVDQRPVVVPTLHWRIADRVYWHGNAASRMLRANEAGGEVCLCATVFDGWVMARSAFNHSANYRAVMCFGTPEVVENANEKTHALKLMMDHHFPGRWDQLRPVKAQELKATLVLSMKIDEASAKVRSCGVDDDEEDLDWPVWAGILPLDIVQGIAQPDEGVPDNLLPPHAW